MARDNLAEAIFELVPDATADVAFRIGVVSFANGAETFLSATEMNAGTRAGIRAAIEGKTYDSAPPPNATNYEAAFEQLQLAFGGALPNETFRSST